MKFYPCVFDCRQARINRRVGGLMTHGEATDFLRKNYRKEWLEYDAIPQPVTRAVYDQLAAREEDE